MVNALRTRSLALLLVGLLAWPAAARIYLACPDGTPCPDMPLVATPAGCCAPSPCDDHPAAPNDGGCIVRAEPAPLYVAPAAAADLTHLPLLAELPAGFVTVATDPSFVAAPARECRPPTTLAPKQGRLPRPPPHAHA